MEKAFAVFSQLLLLFLGVFLMIVVLLQRGRGGGLAGAFGGLGGQSAFGTKAGDVFTKITVGIAIAWVLVAGGSGYILRAASESRAREGLPENPEVSAPADSSASQDNLFESSTDLDSDGDNSGSSAQTPASTGSGESEK